VATVARSATKPVLAAWLGALDHREVRDALEAGGVPDFYTPEHAVEAFSYLAAYRRNQRWLLEVPAPQPEPEPPDTLLAERIREEAGAANHTLLTDWQAQRLLRAFGLPVEPAEPADTLKEQALGRVRAAPDSELKRVQLDLIGEKQSAANLQARMLAVQLAQPVPPLTIPPGNIAVIDCDNDPVIPPAVRAAVRERYAGAGYFNIAGGSHHPYILCGDEYNRIVAACLA
jgi:hypothetical protein